MKWRITSLILGFGILYSFLIFAIYKLQIEKGEYYLSLAEARNSAGGLLEAPRGNIYFTDKNNNPIPVILNKEYPVIYAVPTEIQKNAESAGLTIRSYAEKLSPVLNVSPDELEKRLSKKNDQYELLLKKAYKEQIAEIANFNLKGIYVKNQTLRFYPFGTLAAHLLGFVSPANESESSKHGNTEIGRYGAELYFNNILIGKPGEVKGDTFIEPQRGNNVSLTIDRNIQAQAEEILRKLIEEHQAKSGTIIVEEPATGKILAMGSLPDFDPNEYSKFGIEKFLNPAVQAVYEPGSIFKLITMSAGIDSGKITPDTTYYDTGSFTANGKTITNWDFNKVGPHGKQTMTGVIENSINTGAVFAEKKTGNDIFYNYLVRFGLNELTGVNLPGEVRGSLNNLKRGREIDFATAAYGQGVSVTPIELINAISAIANSGVLMKPYILADDKPKIIRRVIGEDTAKAVTKMIVSAVNKNVLAVIPDYSVAGKTGTAFVPDFTKRGYTDEVINTYVGFAPASEPKFVILIKLDKPTGSPLAGQTVVPSFKELAQFILNYYNIGPDNLAE